MKTNKKRFTFITLAALITSTSVFSGCGLIFGGSQRVDNKSHNYTVVRLDHSKSSGEWLYKPSPKTIDDESADAEKLDESGLEEIADLAFVNQSNGAIISLNSVCRSFDKRSLKDLMQSLIMGIPRLSDIKYSNTSLDQSGAIGAEFETSQPDTRGPAKSDAKFKIRAVVLQKNKCNYDFMLISEKKGFKKNNSVFEEFLKGFHAD